MTDLREEVAVAAPPRTNTVHITEEQVPHPTGFRLLVAVPEASDTYSGGILKAETAKKVEELATMVVQVVEMGPDAYGDSKMFPSGPYCKEGDFVLIRAYSGTRFKIHGRECFRIINDNSVEAVVADPTGFSRI